MTLKKNAVSSKESRDESLAKLSDKSNNCLVNYLVIALFVMTHVFVFSEPGFVRVKLVIERFEITHTHDHSEVHHHDHGDVEIDSGSVSSEGPSDEHTHKREIIVSHQILYILSDICNSLNQTQVLVSYPKYSDDIPQSPFLQGLLRPPIFV